MGFKFVKTGDIARKSVIMTRNDIIFKRCQYLREKKLESAGYPFIYLDETFIHKNLVTNKTLVCDEELLEIIRGLIK